MLAALGTAAACRQDAPAAERTPLAATTIPDSGAAPLRIADYQLTSDRFGSWRGAQNAVARLPDDPAFRPLLVGAATDADVDRAVVYLSNRPDLRQAIEHSGLSVREYVLTTLALARAAQLRGDTRLVEDGALSAEDRALLPRYRHELRHAHRVHAFRVVEYDGDDDDDDDDGEHDPHHEHEREHERGHEREHERGRRHDHDHDYDHDQ